MAVHGSLRRLFSGRSRAVLAGIAAAVMRAMGEFDGAGALGQVNVPVLSIGSAVPANAAADLRGICPAITIGQTSGRVISTSSKYRSR
jgi:hypothetical protein